MNLGDFWTFAEEAMRAFLRREPHKLRLLLDVRLSSLCSCSSRCGESAPWFKRRNNPFLHASWPLETSWSVELPLNMYNRWFGDGQLVDLCTSVTPSGFGDGRYWCSGPFQVTSGVKILTTRCSNVCRINCPSVSPSSGDRFPTPKRPMSLKKSWGLLPWPHGDRLVHSRTPARHSKELIGTHETRQTHGSCESSCLDVRPVSVATWDGLPGL